MTYPLPTNFTGVADMFRYANIVTDNQFIIMLLLSVYVIPLIYLLIRNPDKPWKCSVTAGFIVTITAIFLRVINILTVDWYIYLCVISVAIPLVFGYLKDSST